MKLKILFLTILNSFFFLNVVSAQNIAYGLFAGPNLRNLSYGTGNVLSHPDFGPDLGALVELRYSEHFAIQPALEYSAQGSKDGPFVSTTGYSGGPYNNDVKFGELNYLMIPVLAKLSWGMGEKSPFRIFVSAGPYIGYLLSADQVLINNGQKIPGSQINVSSQLHAINVGGEGNTGLSYFFNTSSLSLQTGGNYGLAKLQRDSNGTNYAGALAVVVSYSFWFSDNFLTDGHFRPKR